MSSKPKEKPLPWQKSVAKALVEEGLYQGWIPLDAKNMGPKQVYEMREEFKEYKYENFRSNLYELRKKIKAGLDRAEEEEKWLEHDRRMFPKPMMNHRGEPRWEGSRAEKRVKHDIDDGSYPIMTPKQLYLLRDEYKEYSLETIRKHLHQEIQSRKYINYLKSKNVLNKEKKVADIKIN